MRTAAPEKWEARMHGGHGLPALLPAKNKTRRNMRDRKARKRKLTRLRDGEEDENARNR